MTPVKQHRFFVKIAAAHEKKGRLCYESYYACRIGSLLLTIPSCAPMRSAGILKKLCAEAREYGFAMVAINPAPVSLCKDLLAGTSVHVGAAVGFPLGQSTPKVKKYETVDAIANGADEIDYVINITQLKEKNYDFIEHEMAGIVEECRGAGVISKVIFENCYLTEGRKSAHCVPSRGRSARIS